MPKIDGPIKKYGHTLHPNNQKDVCIYCGNPAPNTYDYVPPKEIVQDDELRAKMLEPPYAVSACGPCKSDLYLYRFRLSTVPQRIAFLRAKSVRKSDMGKAKKEFNLGLVNPWQTVSTDPMTGNETVIDRPDHELTDELRAMRDELARPTVSLPETPYRDTPDNELTPDQIQVKYGILPYSKSSNPDWG